MKKRKQGHRFFVLERKKRLRCISQCYSCIIETVPTTRTQKNTHEHIEMRFFSNCMTHITAHLGNVFLLFGANKKHKTGKFNLDNKTVFFRKFLGACQKFVTLK